MHLLSHVGDVQPFYLCVMIVASAVLKHFLSPRTIKFNKTVICRTKLQYSA